MAQIKIQEVVMQVTAVRGENRAPFKDSPADDYETGVENRHNQDNKWNRQSNKRGSFNLAYYTSGSYHKAEKH